MRSHLEVQPQYLDMPVLEPVGLRREHVLHGRGLDGRLFTDLSVLYPDRMATPTDHFFIRTGASDWLPQADGWEVRIGSATLPARWFEERRQPLGEVLMECSGNRWSGAFRLLSAATWEGVLLQNVLEAAGPGHGSEYLMVSGFDTYPEPSHTDPPSTPGADWIFPVERLFEAEAALVTRMNGAPLTRDHGAPVRLLIPNWYGCCNIKWVTDIRYVDADTPSTSHMRWFASRTHQVGVPALAREYLDARIETAAMPIRVERWSDQWGIGYWIVGIVWGGRVPAPGLLIRVGESGEWEPVHVYHPPANTRSWSMWAHRAVLEPGTFCIQLQTSPPAGGTRLARGFYRRYVRIE